MLEITTRQFRLEVDEKDGLEKILNASIFETIKSLPGYIPGSLRGFNGDYRADFAVKVI